MSMVNNGTANFLELYRSVVPPTKIINDNHGQHYRVHQGIIQWLTDSFNDTIRGYSEMYTGRGQNRKLQQVKVERVCGWEPVPVERAKTFEQLARKDGGLYVRAEVWRPRELRFDPQNYAKTFKAPLDLLVHGGWLSDDSWKVLNGIIYTGGGGSVWKDRAWRYGGDGLPDDLLQWWLDEKIELNAILIRIIMYGDAAYGG